MRTFASGSLWRSLGQFVLLKRFAQRDAENFILGFRPPRRFWECMVNGIAENCEQCGRIIEPGAERYQDWVSGHLRRHVECHQRAEANDPAA
jgi:SpoVK/Ycf46/Vps4 family AAA+-type ATPase